MKKGVFDGRGLAAALKRKRKAERLTLREVGKRLNPPVSQGTLSRIENGTGEMPDSRVYGALCAWLGVPASRFVRESRSAVIAPDGDVLGLIQRRIEAAPDLDEKGKQFLIEIVEAGYRNLGQKNLRVA